MQFFIFLVKINNRCGTKVAGSNCGHVFEHTGYFVHLWNWFVSHFADGSSNLFIFEAF